MTEAAALPELEDIITDMGVFPEATPEAAPAPEVPETPEATETPPVVAPEVTPVAAAGLAEIIQRENLFEQRRKDAKATDDAAAERDALVEKLATPEGVLALLEERGLSFQDVTNARLKQNAPADPNAPVKGELQELRAKVQLLETQRAEEKKLSVYSEAQTAVKNYVSENNEKFPLVNALGAHEKVFEHIYTSMNQTGKVMSEEVAASHIEQQLSGIKAQFDALNGTTVPDEVNTPKSDAAPKVITNTVSTATGGRVPQEFIVDNDEALEDLINKLS